ncbi:MAG: NOB1 family endonuclease [Thermoplasmata archaeon]
MRLVLDTSAILSGMDFAGEVYIPSSVMREARNQGGLDPRVEAVLETKSRIFEPRDTDLQRVSKASRETGDDASLSRTDQEVLALALQLDAAVVTDDYAIQNVADRLGLPYRPALLPGIRRREGWSFRCRGCGRYWSETHEACPVCGAEVRRYRARA